MENTPFQKRLKSFRTGDGSFTLYDEQLDEAYHSGNGALSESRHVFIERGLHAPGLTPEKGKDPLRVFEVGFGTGINAYLFLKEAEKGFGPIRYESIEPYPLDAHLCKSIAEDLEDSSSFSEIHECPWEQPYRLAEDFELLKRPSSLQAYEGCAHADLILYDAFGGKAQPEMWESPILDKALEQGKAGSIFVTYASKGSLKRVLKRRGWKLEPLDGALGKREMLRARYPID